MGQSVHLGEHYRRLRDRMDDTGIENPRLALTELQLFAGLDDEYPDAPDVDETSTPRTITEAQYDATIRYECIRLDGFVETLTHSALVNQGSGLDLIPRLSLYRGLHTGFYPRETSSVSVLRNDTSGVITENYQEGPSLSQ